MIDIADILDKENIFISLRSGCKKQLLNDIAQIISKNTDIECHEILTPLLDREKLGTTAIGDGIAIPHGKVSNLKNMIGCFVRLDQSIDFDADDEKQADLYFVLLAPENSESEHLELLSKLAKIFKNQTLVSELRNADSAELIFSILTRKAAQKAA